MLHALELFVACAFGALLMAILNAARSGDYMESVQLKQLEENFAAYKAAYEKAIKDNTQLHAQVKALTESGIKAATRADEVIGKLCAERDDLTGTLYLRAQTLYDRLGIPHDSQERIDFESEIQSYRGLKIGTPPKMTPGV